MKTVLRLTLFLLLPLTAATLFAQRGVSITSAPSQQRRLALVIGNADYREQPKLCNPLNDARDIAKALQDLGFEVDRVENVDLRGFQASVKKFVQKIKPGDFAFFYFSGHGVGFGHENYLLPVDYRGQDPLDLQDASYPAGRIQLMMENAGARASILALDACRNNPFTNSKGSTGLARVEGGEGTLVAFATAPGMTASDNCQGPNGLFTASLLTALRNRKPGRTVTETFKDAQQQTFAGSNRQQKPWISMGFIDNGQSFWEAPGSEPRDAPASTAGCTIERDALLWKEVKDSNEPDVFRRYLASCPDGVFGSVARREYDRLVKITRGGESEGRNVILKLHGSNTVGQSLAPALAMAFLKRLRATNIQLIRRAAEEADIVGDLNGSAVVIEVKAHGTGTGFKSLGAGTCDIAMASKKIGDADLVGQLRSEGDMTTPEREHVIGLDGISVIVNPANPLQSLTLDQIRRVFTGDIRSWRQLGGPDREIVVFSLDDNSGTYKLFTELAMRGQPLVKGAHRSENHREISDFVAFDRDAIAFVGLPYVQGNRLVAVSDGSSVPRLPEKGTIGRRDYLLSRELYLYTKSRSASQYVDQFVKFATFEGQQLVESAGFVGMNVNLPEVNAETGRVFEDRPRGEFGRFVEGAQRLNFTFRFQTASWRLDNKGMDDTVRLAKYLRENPHYETLYVGFTDNVGPAAANQALSEKRAASVAQEVDYRGPFESAGFGLRYPVASNETPEGRNLNRRVEVWVRRRSR